MRIQSRPFHRSRRKGTTTVVVALCLAPLIGASAFVIDGGMLMAERRRAQGIADAAAHAAACSLYKNYATDHGLDPQGKAQAFALAIAAANGYGSDATSTVTIHIPPTSGSNNGKTGYVEAIVQYNQPRYFSGIFGSAAIPVKARAVSRVISYDKPSIILLEPTASGALNVTGNGELDTDGSVQVNSSNSTAAIFTGNSEINVQGRIDVTGNYRTSGSVTFSEMPHPNQAAMSDPLGSLAPPAQPGNVGQSTNNGTIYSPGVYSSISIPGTKVVTFQSGTYYFTTGGLNISGSGVIYGKNVLLYFGPNAGSISVSGSGTLNLTPPTSGDYAGISIYQDRNNGTAMTLSGSTTMSRDGAIYAPAATVSVTGSTNGTPFATQVIAERLNLSGSGVLKLQSPSSGGGIDAPQLVEAEGN
jgi:hypothetical protein